MTRGTRRRRDSAAAADVAGSHVDTVTRHGAGPLQPPRGVGLDSFHEASFLLLF